MRVSGDQRGCSSSRRLTGPCTPRLAPQDNNECSTPECDHHWRSKPNSIAHPTPLRRERTRTELDPAWFRICSPFLRTCDHAMQVSNCLIEPLKLLLDQRSETPAVSVEAVPDCNESFKIT